jgi:hypothetical protein
MLKIATIGIGNAGNQISQLGFTKYQIPGIAINSSEKDLEQVKSIPHFIIGDNKGAGKSRDAAKTFIKENIKDILVLPELINHVKNTDIVFMISSIGGGTGSGINPVLTEILSKKFPSTKFIVVGIFPPLREALSSQQNAIEFLKEINSIDNITYMLYDNEKYSDKSSTIMMEHVNEEIVDHLSILRGDYMYDTQYTSIDDKDLLRIISTPGRLAVYSIFNIKDQDVDKESLEDMMISVIKDKSTNVNLQRDKNIKRLGVVTCLGKTLMDKYWNPSIPLIQEFLGEWVEGFDHTFVGDKSNSLMLILSGLSMPDDRIETIESRIDHGVELLKVRKNSILNDMDDVLDTVKKIIGVADTSSEDVSDKNLDLDDILSKY